MVSESLWQVESFMKIENEFTFAGRREVVWELLQDPDVLAKAIPGAKKLERTDDDEYEGEIRIGYLC